MLLPAFYRIIWHMTSSKSFDKIAILKIWQLVFFWGVKTHFGKLALKWYIFRHEKKILCHNFWSNIWSKWSQICERLLCSWRKNDQKWPFMNQYFLQNWKNPDKQKNLFHVIAFDPIKIWTCYLSISKLSSEPLFCEIC